MSAFDELAAAGQLGREGVELLYRIVGAVARIHRFPPPEGYSNWTKDAITEVAHDFLTARPGIDRMSQIFLLASDEESFERVLHQAIRNHLRSVARATEFGSLMRRVRNVLEDDDRFVLAGGGSSRWTLAVSGARDPYTGPMEFVVAVAWGVKGVRLVRWDSETRRGPYADRDSIARICERVLQAFPTAMTVAQLSRAVAVRLNVGELPLVVELDDELAKPNNVSASDLIADNLVSDEVASTIWDRLTERERILVPALDQSVRDAARQMGIGKSQAAVSMKRVRTMVDEESPDDASRGAVARRLQDLADAYFRTT